MAEVAHDVEQEFWRPPATSQGALETKATSGMVDACDGCGTEFVVGARFCHVCGATRQAQTAVAGVNGWNRSLEFARHPEFHNIRDRIGLPTSSLVAFIIGVGCVLGAITVGLIFTAQTVLDWQAVQVWRIEWLLGSAAAFLAGILLKKSAS